MQLDAQLKKLFSILFETAGFDETTKNKLVADSLNIWLTKSSLEIYNLLTDAEKSEFKAITDNLQTNPGDKSARNGMLEFINKGGLSHHKKVIDIYFKNAEEIVERYLSQFSKKASPELQEELKKKVAGILKKPVI